MLHIDKDEVVQFFEYLYPSEPWPGVIHLDIIQIGADKQKRLLKRLSLDSLNAVRSLPAAALNVLQEQGGNIFYSVGFMEPNRMSGTKASLVALAALFADADDVEDLDEYLSTCPLPPTGWIRSGPTGYHFYWKLRNYSYDVTGTPPPVEKALRKVHAWVNGDHTANMNRLLRVPGTFNMKPEYTSDGQVPPRAEIGSWEVGRTYTLEEVLEQPISYAEVRLEPYLKRALMKDGNLLSGEEGAKLKRSGRDFVLVKELLRAGHTKEEIKVLAHDPKLKWSEKFLARPEYFDYTYDKARSSASANQGATQMLDSEDGGHILRKKA